MRFIPSPAAGLMEESVIREMTRVAEDCGAVNLAQGFPEYGVPEPVLAAAHAALDGGLNRYSRTWGEASLRSKLSGFLERHWGLAFDPEEELVVTCGASEAIMATLLAALAPGDGMVIPEPIYENYLPAARLAAARPEILPVDPFTGAWSVDRLADALSRSKAMILNTPTNPSGKVWTREELVVVAELVERHDVLLVTDETYAFILAPGQVHVPPAVVGGLAPRTVTIGSFSKTYAVTGWRVGFAAAPAPIMAAIRRLHDFLTVCAPTPFQRALEVALDLPDSYYSEVAAEYRRRYEILGGGLADLGFRVNDPQGTYFLLVDLSDLAIDDDRRWAVELARSGGVAGVPGSSFLWSGMPRADGAPPDRRGRFLRLSFGKSEAELREALHRLGRRQGPRGGDQRIGM